MADRTSSPPLPIDLITLGDEEPDLIISFVIAGTMGSDSVTLIRTPKYEVFEDASARGVRVYRDYDSEPTSIVSRIALDDRSATIEASQSAYVLDLSKVDDDEVDGMKRILTKMNFDANIDVVIE